MNSVIKTYIDTVEDFTSRIEFPVIIGGDIHRTALVALTLSIKEMAKKIEAQDILIKQLTEDK